MSIEDEHEHVYVLSTVTHCELPCTSKLRYLSFSLSFFSLKARKRQKEVFELFPFHNAHYHIELSVNRSSISEKLSAALAGFPYSE